MIRNSHAWRYRGRLQAVVFDWAGTTIDYGSAAPAAVFVEVFRRAGVEITTYEARRPMGMAKRAHISALLHEPAISARWATAQGSTPGEAEIDRLYQAFLPLQLECLPRFAELIPGAAQTVAACRERGLKIGSGTGYVREMMDVLEPLAREQGYAPDTVVCASDIERGRPAPWILLENARRLNVFPPQAIVKVDDTTVGVEEGLNAGAWSIGVAKTGNEMGCTAAELAALADSERDRRLSDARQRLLGAGAHYVIDSVAELMPVIDEIEARLLDGDRP